MDTHTPDTLDDLDDLDDLDVARKLLDTDVATYDEGVAYGIRAIAHVLLWNAERQRDYQRAMIESQRQQAQRLANMPPPLMSPYQGF